MKDALETNLGHKISTDGYLIRVARLSYQPTDDTKRHKTHKSQSSRRLGTNTKVVNVESKPKAVNLIMNMEQVAVRRGNGFFPRNIKRLKNGEDSLEEQYLGTDAFVKEWLRKYYLSSKNQQLYFWSFILCICIKLKQVDIEIENTLVTIPKRKAYLKDNDSILSNSSEVEQEQQDAMLYNGFLVAPAFGKFLF